MSHASRLTATVTTDGAGAATVYVPVAYGLLSQIRYVKTDFANGVDFNITVEGTGETLWAENNVDASATRAPRQATHGTDGVVSLFAAGGAAVQDKIAIVQDRIKIAVTNGGAAKVGTFHFLLV